MRIYYLVTLILSVAATSAHAIDYLCPKRMTVETQSAAEVDGVESLNLDTTQLAHDAHYIDGISLYLGHPRDMAQLVPDNENQSTDISIWSTPANKENYWMACHYTSTSLIYAKKIQANTASCSVMKSGTHPKNILGLTCK